MVQQQYGVGDTLLPGPGVHVSKMQTLLLTQRVVCCNNHSCLHPYNVSTALSLLLQTINKHKRAHPDGVHIIAGDFKRANLKTVLPNFHQHVSCPTRGENTLDHVYSNIRHAYKATPFPHLGLSDHLSLILTPAYTPPTAVKQSPQ